LISTNGKKACFIWNDITHLIGSNRICSCLFKLKKKNLDENKVKETNDDFNDAFPIPMHNYSQSISVLFNKFWLCFWKMIDF